MAADDTQGQARSKVADVLAQLAAVREQLLNAGGGDSAESIRRERERRMAELMRAAHIVRYAKRRKNLRR